MVYAVGGANILFDFLKGAPKEHNHDELWQKIKELAIDVEKMKLEIDRVMANMDIVKTQVANLRGWLIRKVGVDVVETSEKNKSGEPLAL